MESFFKRKQYFLLIFLIKKLICKFFNSKTAKKDKIFYCPK